MDKRSSVGSGCVQAEQAVQPDLTQYRRDDEPAPYFDIRLGNQPDGRLTKFIGTNLPMVLPDAGGRYDEPRVPLRCSSLPNWKLPGDWAYLLLFVR